MDTKALFKIDYGLYILSAKDENKDNACVINTLMQITSDPCMVEIAVNKLNYTCEIIQKTKKFNISILSNESKFDVFKHFGFQSGRDVNKFERFVAVERAQNGILYVTECTNAFISASVEKEIDLGSHVLFIARVDEARVLSDEPTVTYDFYQQNIKPKPQAISEKNGGWRCKICNFIYKGDILPKDYICPLCKHGAVDFEKI